MKKPYKQILVCLDGSKLAETALPEAVALARLTGAKITLLETVWPIIDIMDTGTQVAYVERVRKEEANRYLKSVARRPEYRGVPMQPVVRIGPAADVIIDYARSKPVDLIVMSTHGRSGVRRWVFGSVADKVLRGATRPVLLVRAFAAGGRGKRT